MALAEKNHTDNEAVAMMHKCVARDLRMIADHCEEHNYPAEEIIKFMRELADEAEAQVVVVELRDLLSEQK